MNKHKKTLLSLYEKAIEHVNGQNAVANFLRDKNIHNTVYLIAIGKAAVSMAKGAIDVLGDKITAGLVITKVGYGENLPFECIESSHPVPDEKSITAGKRLCEFIHDIPQNSDVLFLVSGGTSALVEVLKTGFSLEDLQKLNRDLLSSGIPIAEMNLQRSKISAIKGGGLLKHFRNQNILQLMISDVPSNNPAEIGSGLLFGYKNKIAKTSAIVTTHIVASIFDAIKVIENKAIKLGFNVDCSEKLLTGDAEKNGRELARRLLTLENTILIRGGETTLVLPKNPGTGGRNQHLALAAATVLQDNKETYFLAAGTDGTDGPTEYAGAIVSGDTIQKNDNAEQFLIAADSTTFLKQKKALIKTGPTGTNVMDLIIGLRTLM